MKATDYVSCPLALKLKEAGFGEQCLGSYCKRDLRLKISPYGRNWNGMGDNMYSAPLLYHAQKWLREVKHLCVTVYAQPYNGVPYYAGYILFHGVEIEILDNDGHWFDNYENALSETISVALDMLNEEDKI